MRFRYIGKEPSEFMGFQWVEGVEHDVEDPHAVKKLSGSCLFETVDGETKKSAKAGKAAKKVDAEAETEADAG